jgi:hypothetical protein
MRTIYLINLFIICCYSFVVPPTPHNSNKPSKTFFSNKLKRISSSLAITTNYCKKDDNENDNDTDKLFNKLIVNIIYNYVLYYYIYYYLYEHYHIK